MMSPSPQVNAGLEIVASLKRMNFYQRLGLSSKSATEDVLRSAFANRVESLKRSSASGMQETFLEALSLIQEALDVLGDPQRRAMYDQSLVAANPPRRPPAWRTTAAAEPGLLLGRYKLGAVLSESSRATLYYAEDTQLSRQVVVKQVRAELLQSAEYRRVVREEAEMFARYTASHLVKILDHDLHSGATVLEKMESDLRSMMTSKGCGAEQAAEILRDCLKGLTALHTLGVAHGRVELGHILLDARGGAKLTIAPGVRGASGTVLPGRSTQHVAPELLNPAVFGEPSVASDIYSLGFVILELLAGKNFARRVSPAITESSDNPESWWEWHASATDHLSSIDELIPGISVALAEVLRQMTRKQQQERFSNAMECLQAIDRILSLKTQPISDTPISAAEEPGCAVDLLGTPDQLHHVFQPPLVVGWLQIIRSPSLLLRAEAKQHRQFLLLGSVLAVVLMLGLELTSGPKGGSLRPVVEAPEGGKNDQPLPLPIDPVTIPATSPEPVETPEPPPPGYTITFEIKPGGGVTRIESVADQGQPPTPIVSIAANTWFLGEGHYRIACHDGGGKKFGTELSVPSGSGAWRWTIMAPEPLVVQPPEPADGTGTSGQGETDVNSPAPSAPSYIQYPYVHPQFGIVGISDRNKESCRMRLMSILRSYSRKPSESLLTVSDELLVTPQQRDPRQTFCYALQALAIHDFDLMTQLCYRSLDEAEHFDVPFVLPVQLVSQLECHEGRLRGAVAACRDVVRWMGIRQQTKPDERFAEAMRDTAKCSGNVIGFIESAYGDNLPTDVDTEGFIALLRRYSNDEQWNAFMGSRVRMAELHRDYVNSYNDERGSNSVRRDVFSKERRELPFDPLPVSVGDKRKFVDAGGDDDSNAVTDPREPLRPEPSRSAFRDRPVRSRRFLSYQPLDVSSLADAALATIPDLTVRISNHE